MNTDTAREQLTNQYCNANHSCNTTVAHAIHMRPSPTVFDQLMPHLIVVKLMLSINIIIWLRSRMKLRRRYRTNGNG